MHALGQHLDGQLAAYEPAQRGRVPHPLVIAAAGIEPDHEIDSPQARRERLEIRREIVAAGLLASLDHAGATRMRDALRLQRADGGEGSEYRVAVVRAAAPVELAVLEQRIPRTVAVAPSAHLRLLVEMAVQQHGPITLVAAGNIEIEQRSAAGQAHDLHRETAYRLLLHPGIREADDALDVAVGFPLRIEMRRLRRDANVVGKLRDDFAVPLGGDRGEKRRRVH